MNRDIVAKTNIKLLPAGSPPSPALEMSSRATNLLAGEHYAKSAELCHKAIELDPNDANTYNTLGIAQERLGESEKAIVSLKKAIELDPDFASPYSNLGAVLNYAGRHSEALELCQKAIELDPKSAEAHFNCAVALLGANTYPNGIEEAMGYFKEACRLKPKEKEMSTVYQMLCVQLRIDPDTAKFIDQGPQTSKPARPSKKPKNNPDPLPEAC